jgi:hypothetical protein
VKSLGRLHNWLKAVSMRSLGGEARRAEDEAGPALGRQAAIWLGLEAGVVGTLIGLIARARREAKRSTRDDVRPDQPDGPS